MKASERGVVAGTPKPPAFRFGLRSLFWLNLLSALICGMLLWTNLPAAAQIVIGLYLVVICGWLVLRLPMYIETWRRLKSRRHALQLRLAQEIADSNR